MWFLNQIAQKCWKDIHQIVLKYLRDSTTYILSVNLTYDVTKNGCDADLLLNKYGTVDVSSGVSDADLLLNKYGIVDVSSGVNDMLYKWDFL